MEYAYELTGDPAERDNIAATLPLPVKMAWLNLLNARAGRDTRTWHSTSARQAN